jgi:hypothetical protein
MRHIVVRRAALVVGVLAAASVAVAQQNVVWTQVVNATASGNTLRKTAGCDGCPNAGGISQQQIVSGTGSVTVSPDIGSSGGLALYAGLGHGLSTPPATAQFAYAFSFWANGGWEVRELGLYKTEGTFVAGDTFTIAIEAGSVVKYYKNGAPVYTSAAAPAAYPYVLGTTLIGTAAAAANAMITTAGGSGTPVPTSYTAIADTVARPKPAVPAIGAAGYTFADPTFSSRMMRVTDASTRPGSPNRSYRVSSNAHLAAWNTTSTYFYAVSGDGTIIPYAFNAATLQASRLQPSPNGNGGLTLAFYVEPQFSLVTPDVIYGIASGGNNRTIKQYDFGTGVYTTILDLDTIVSGLTGYVGGIISGGTSPEQLMVFFGGAQQDQHYYALWFPVNNIAARKLLNTVTSTINGVPTNITLNFHLHSTHVDKSGRYVFLNPTSADAGAPRYASPMYVWDTTTDIIVPITSGGQDGSPNLLPGGHDSAGHGYWVNQDCCTSTTWDAAQWQFRPLNDLAAKRDLINPVLLPKEIYLSDHSSWNNAQPGVLVPFLSATYRYGNNITPWRAWDDEIVAVQSDVAPGVSATVWRFGHHRSDVGSDSNPSTPYFWYEPIANMAPNGRWALFTSNWEKTLGIDPTDGTHRQDVFIVELLAPQ